MPKIFKGMIVVAMLALCVGCASTGNKMDQTAIQSLQPGVTTLENMRAEFGEPYTQGFNTNGQVTAVWIYAQVGPLGTNSSHQTLSAIFNKDGVLEQASSQQGSMPQTRYGY